MKNNRLLVFVLLFFLLSACRPSSTPASQTGAGLRVLAVETFLADIAGHVAGERLKIDSLIPLGLDPHAFEPTPQDVARIAESQVVIANGAGFEEWLEETLQNAGGKRAVIEAAAGLASRTAREGEVAEMGDQELGEAMCAQAGSEQAQAVLAGGDPANPAELPVEAGLFTLKLAKQADGAYAGFIRYATGEAGDFQMATATGKLKVQEAASGAEIGFEKSLPLECAPVSQGHIIELGKGGQYILALTGFSSEETSLLIGPAGGHHHHEGDPHFWLDPIRVVHYVENIRDGLITADPAGKEVYTQNAAAYIARLNELDAWIKAQVEQIPAGRRLIVTNHESFGYFADRYGFKIIGTIIPGVTTGAAPSAQQLARLVDTIRATGAIAIFLETGSNPKLAEQIAQETGIKVVSELYSHSITAPDGKAPSYIDMMKYNVQAIVEALR